ncbi:MAG: hypothetical protein HKP26_04315 [Nitrosopumilus sp.]|uniref:hypothetical protein n=1 Tax=Nitrosopumilus sp. b3 TaxID=2109909 RepID=UPI0015F51E1C|nr:hypothetical protein [Nitrosopumilus sp. b3]KAF6247746.1 hypothetical protein C6990_04750 [Nitrosopumilus sp. b3]MBT8173441.1 hypothetical protein [Nitrosopumilus sp.]NNM02774.1 hypothetical protein [Nitrosopumilus sp.]
MSNTENLKNSIKETSGKLAKLGTELADIKFSYKVEEKPSKDYWEKRLNEFRNYSDKSLEYYNQVHTMMNLINKEESQMFLLRISKFRQIGMELLEIMQKIKDNPSISDPKDKQQSQWSKEIKNNLNEQSNKCLNHEKEMNKTFRDFYQNQLKQILDS